MTQYPIDFSLGLIHCKDSDKRNLCWELHALEASVCHKALLQK